MRRRILLFGMVVGCLALSALDGGRVSGAFASTRSYALRAGTVGAAGGTSSGSGRLSRGTLGQSSPGGVLAGSIGDHAAGFWSAWTWTVFTGIDDDVPEYTNALYQNYPNPFNPTTSIRYGVAAAAVVSIDIFDVTGRRVTELVKERKAPGMYTVEWDGTDSRGNPVASGVYFCRLIVADYQATKKITILK